MFVLEKYGRFWAVLDTKTCVWYFIGCGRKYCKQKIKELNGYVDVTK